MSEICSNFFLHERRNFASDIKLTENLPERIPTYIFRLGLLLQKRRIGRISYREIENLPVQLIKFGRHIWKSWAAVVVRKEKEGKGNSADKLRK